MDAAKLAVFVGGTQGDVSSKTLPNLARRLESADPTQTTVVFTGNYTAVGEFPEKNSKNRAQAESDVQAHIDAVDSFLARGGPVYFLPGHRDYRNGRGAVRRLRDFVNKRVRLVRSKDEADDDEFDAMPNADCGDPFEIELNNSIAVVLLNSAWWMQDWAAHPKTNQGCDVKSRAEFQEAFNSLTKGYRTRRMLVAVHHPIDSLGPYGGSFDGVDHLIPPIFGTIAIWAKQTGLIPEYRNHAMFDSFASTLKNSADTFGSFVFVSGHDRSLQHLQVDEQVQIISGHSGGDPSRVDSPYEGDFTAEASGWAEVHLEESGEGFTSIVSGDIGKQMFRKALPAIPKLAKSDLPPPPPLPTGPVSSTYTKREMAKTGLLRSWVIGDFYRDSYTLKLDFDVLNVDAMEGGLTPVSIGGGSQTNSIRFIGPDGTQWAARAATKDSTRYLPYPFNRVRPIRYFLEEGFTGIHPSAATTVPALAEALGILHTKPKLMYLPDQTGLGEFRGFIGDEVILLERRPKEPKEGALPAHLGGGLSPVGETDYKSTTDTLEKVRNKPWKHEIDQEGWLRARLLDILLGDWDRHQDQWRFAKLTLENDHKYYVPIPRDRDQACAHYDGAFLFLARMAIPEIRRLRPFDADIGDVTWVTYNARPVDAIFLSRIGKERWMQIAREVQSKITDEVIAKGMSSWPKSAYDLHGRDIETKLRSRRDQIVDAAEKFFYQVNEAVEVLGSEKSDRIELSYPDDERLTVRLKRRKEGEAGTPYFERTFHADETEEIRIFALDGEDELLVSGTPHSDIQVRFIGGTDDDRVAAVGSDDMSARGIAVYDRDDGAEIDSSISINDERSGNSYRNQYDFNDPHHQPTKASAVPSFLINADDGLLLQGSGSIVLGGFKRVPFASSHTLSAAVATTTAGVQGSYVGLFPGTLGPLDQELRLSGTTPLYTRNFFGYTSEFADPNDQPTGREFFRLRKSNVELRHGISGALLSGTLRLGLRGLGQFVDVEATEDRFIVESADISDQELSSRVYIGSQAFAELSTLDNASYPKRGFFTQLLSTVRSDVTSGTDERIGTSGFFSVAAGTFIPFDRSQRFVLGTRAKFQHVVGDFPFYHAPTLGDQDLRAYNDEQLSGNGVFAQSVDLRVELFRFREGLPGTIGVAASLDHGFAFGSLVADEEYNVIAGGTVFWSILDFVGLQVSYYQGLDEGSRLTFGLGPLFANTGYVQ
ncbi:MAG: hypothetical protein AAF735_04745 [Myxococcota bacterium]